MRKLLPLFTLILLLSACGKAAGKPDSSPTDESPAMPTSSFNTDSAFAYLKTQVDFGPRVPNSKAHDAAAQWLAAELKRHGAHVSLQTASLKAFDGTPLNMTNIFGSFNPDAPNRLLLLAHYDCRPWADEDPDPANHNTPVDGANDGASGVAILLETARMLHSSQSPLGIDILFSDCEDYGTEGDDDSWALGTRYFAQNPIRPGYKPSQAILLDMVGGKNAQFPAEFFSRNSAPELDDAFRSAARSAGHGAKFPNILGSAINDDHVELIKVGIPAIDIIDYRPGSGFCPTWHTTADNVSNIDPETLRAVGESLFQFLSTRQ